MRRDSGSEGNREHPGDTPGVSFGPGISSLQNPRLKELVRLKENAAFRKKEGLMIAEGERLVAELPPEWIRELYFSERFLKAKGKPPEELAPEGFSGRVRVLSDSAFAKLSDTKTPQGILAVGERPRWDIRALKTEAPLLLALEDIQDPGNLGTMFRLCEGAGADALFTLGSCPDPYSPKALRAAMGSSFRLPWFGGEDHPAFRTLCKGMGIRIYAAELSASSDYAGFDYREGAVFLIGNEGRGLSEEALSIADERILIPMKGRSESMNAAMAAGILLFEAARQRRRTLNSFR